jgi:hypothetical protein
MDNGLMSVDLDSLVAKLATRTVTVRGVAVNVRALPADEQRLVFDKIPIVRPPKGPPGGVQVDPDLDRNNDLIWELRRALTVAAAAGLCRAGLRWSREMSATDALTLARAVFSTLTLEELSRLHAAAQDAGDVAAADPAKVIGTGTELGN